MFKRLTKSRRHSADEVGCTVLPGRLALNDSFETSLTYEKSRESQIETFTTARLKVAKNKYTRRSCGDAPSMQSLLAPVDDRSTCSSSTYGTDYQTVTAVPAFIVEYAPEKQQQSMKGLGTWGRRMSKKIESFRRGGSRNSICSSPEKTDPVVQENNDDYLSNNNNNDNVSNKNQRAMCNFTTDEIRKSEKKVMLIEKSSDVKKSDGKVDRKCLLGTSHRSPSPFKSFFTRMGSTGMLNSTRINGQPLENHDQIRTIIADTDNLFRSCSTSQLNTSPTYVKGDDPSEGIDLQIGLRNDRTLSCDDLAIRRSDDDVFSDAVIIDDPASVRPSSTSFRPCDFSNSNNEILRKSNSCDFKDMKKANFPYAFLRSKLTVLPEERQQNIVPKDKRWLNTSSRSNNCMADSERNLHQARHQQRKYLHQQTNLGNGLHDRRFSESSFHNVDHVVLTLGNQRRNSAPGAEQKLSSHYVSSNESGYDSDGPRGESVVISENETTISRYLNTDNLDTSRIVDLDVEKPTMKLISSDTNERFDQSRLKGEFDNTKRRFSLIDQNNGDDVTGLRWHQSNFRRNHQGSNSTVEHPLFRNTTTQSVINVKTSGDSSCPEIDWERLQLDKTSLYREIIQPSKTTRRCRLVQLDKKDSRESLGIRLAQQHGAELRYIVVHLENGGIAHRDGRLRLGDEIIEVEGKELKTLASLVEVQKFLKSFTSNKVHLLAAYEEILPQVFKDMTFAEHYNCQQCQSPEINMPSNSSIQRESHRQSETSINDGQSSNWNEIVQSRKNSDNLSELSFLRTSSEKETIDPMVENMFESQQYLTRHMVIFEKGCGKPSLGFSVVGGRDSPRGEMGIFVRRVFPAGQADLSKSLCQGDEILSLNGKMLRGCTHQEVIELFKAVREGPIKLDVTRRHRNI